jgi:hypothetical protein
MQLESLDALEAGTPAFGGAIRTAAGQTMQHSQERRALDRGIMLGRARQALDLGPTTGLFPYPFKSAGRSDAPGRRTVAAPRSIASRTMTLSAKRTPERNRRSSGPFAWRSSPLPSAAITCWCPPRPRTGFRRFADTRALWRVPRGSTCPRNDGDFTSLRAGTCRIPKLLIANRPFTWQHIPVNVSRHIQRCRKVMSSDALSTTEDGPTGIAQSELPPLRIHSSPQPLIHPQKA